MPDKIYRMDKNLHDIEDLFRKGLEDNEDIPSEKAWDGIEKKLDKENVVSIKRKYDLLKKVALLLLFLLAGLGIYVWKNQNKNLVKTNKDISEIKKDTKTKNDPLTKESDTSAFQKPVDTLTVNKSNNVKTVTESENKIVDKTTLENNNAIPKKSLIPIVSKNLSHTSTKKNKIKFNKPEGPLLSDASKFSIQQKDKLIKKNSNEVVKIKTQNQIVNNQLAVVNNLYAKEALNPKNVFDIKINTTDLFATKQSLQLIALAQINPMMQIEKTIVPKPSIKSSNQSRFAITAFYSPDIAFYHFENNVGANSNNTNFEKSQTESYSSTLGALVDYKISKYWGLQSGITLATSNFNLESETLYAQPDNTGGIKYKLSTPLGDAYVLPSFSNNPNIGDSIFSKSTTHTLQYLGIPLTVKYNFNKGKFTLNPFGGLTANFLTRGRITTELESANDSEFKTIDKIHGLKPFYLSGLAGIGLDYNFYKKFSVCFSPTFRFALNSINRNVPVASFPNSFGFGLGLKMEL